MLTIIKKSNLFKHPIPIFPLYKTMTKYILLTSNLFISPIKKNNLNHKNLQLNSVQKST